jgi:hypothetical protein
VRGVRFTHLLLTRSDYRPDHPAFAERVRLFRELTVPSIAAQTCQRFTRLVETRNPEFREELAALPNVLVVTRPLSTVVLETLATAPWLITSRVDNDDILLPEYVERVQAEFREERAAVDSRGYRWDLRTDAVIHFDHYRPDFTSPFASLIEPATGAVGVRSVHHHALAKLAPVTVLEDRLWVQTIHETNLQMRWIDGYAAASEDESRRVRVRSC